jgi:hypothetical protein
MQESGRTQETKSLFYTSPVYTLSGLTNDLFRPHGLIPIHIIPYNPDPV